MIITFCYLSHIQNLQNISGKSQWWRISVWEQSSFLKAKRCPAPAVQIKNAPVSAVPAEHDTNYLYEMLWWPSLLSVLWSGPFQVTEALGRPQTLHLSTMVSPVSHVTSPNGIINSGGTGKREWMALGKLKQIHLISIPCTVFYEMK